MSVRYAPQNICIPPGFQALLESLAREVLRDQPEDILSFSASYFTEKLKLRDGKYIAGRIVGVREASE